MSFAFVMYYDGLLTITSDGSIVVEASALGLRPGDWPAMLVVGREKEDGSADGLIFWKQGAIMNAEEFGGYVYRSDRGAQITVFND